MTPEFRKVEALLHMGRVDAAVELMERLPAREAPTLEFYRLRGRTLRAAGRYFDAEVAWREAAKLAPQDAGVLAELAATLHAQKRYKDAIPFAREAVGLRPEIAAWHCLRGVIAESLELWTEAETALAAARQLSPNDLAPHVVFGWLMLRTARLEAAEAAFRAALAIQPQSVEATRGLARVLLRQGDRVLARQLYLEVLALDPVQKDPELESTMLIGHPLAGPLRWAEKVPVWLSFLLALPAAGVLVRALVVGFAPSTLEKVLVAVSLTLASAAPLLRVLRPGGPR